MKRNLAYLLVSALLVFSLTACGCTATPQDTSNSGNSQSEVQPGTPGTTNDTMQNSNTSQNSDSSVLGGEGSGDNTQPPLDEGMNDLTNGIDDAVDDLTGQSQSGSDGIGVPFDEMLENGKVDG